MKKTSKKKSEKAELSCIKRQFIKLLNCLGEEYVEL